MCNAEPCKFPKQPATTAAAAVTKVQCITDQMSQWLEYGLQEYALQNRITFGGYSESMHSLAAC